MSNPDKVLVFGAGAFGTALAESFAENGREVLIWGRNPEVAAEINERHTNQRYCAQHKLNANLHATAEWSDRFLDYGTWVYACPSSNLRNFISEIQTRFGLRERSERPFLVNTAKGFDLQKLELHHQVAEETLGREFVRTHFLCLSGPSFAAEILKSVPTCLSLASMSIESSKTVQKALGSSRLRIYTNTDIVGCQVGGATKNVLAIAAGVIEGMGVGQNTQAAFINLGLGEMARLGTALGAIPETFLGFSGVGDLILTCTSELSRNRSFGVLLGKGASVADAQKQVGATIEGFHAASAVHTLVKKLAVRAPICEHVFQVLYLGKTIHEAFDALLARPPGGEWI